MINEDYMDLGEGLNRVKQIAGKHVEAKPESQLLFSIGYAWSMWKYRVLIWTIQTIAVFGWLFFDWSLAILLIAMAGGGVISAAYYSFVSRRAKLIESIRDQIWAEHDVKIGREWIEVMMMTKWKLIGKLPEFGMGITMKRWNNWLKSK